LKQVIERTKIRIDYGKGGKSRRDDPAGGREREKRRRKPSRNKQKKGEETKTIPTFRALIGTWGRRGKNDKPRLVVYLQEKKRRERNRHSQTAQHSIETQQKREKKRK